MLLVTRFVSVVKGKEEWSFILKNFFSMDELGQQLVLFYDLSILIMEKRWLPAALFWVFRRWGFGNYRKRQKINSISVT